jgi:hypothetical protein
MNDPKCDFCSDKPIRWGYTAMPSLAIMTGPVTLIHEEDGRWAACEICHDLIEKRDKDALAKHSLAEFNKHYPGVMTNMPEEMLLKSFREVHDIFWLGYDGAPPVRIEVGSFDGSEDRR